MNTSLGLQGGSGAAAMDVQLWRSAPNTWQFSSVGGGAPIIDFNNAQLIHTSFGLAQFGRCYTQTGAPNTDSALAGVGTIFFGPSLLGNVITLQDPVTLTMETQTFSQIPIVISGFSNGVYDLYINSASATTVAATTTVWSGVNTPPTRSIDPANRLAKNGSPQSLLVAVFRVSSAVVADAPGGTSGGSLRNISNLYNPVPKSMGFGPISVGSSGGGYPTANSTTDSFVVPFVGAYSFSYIVTAVQQPNAGGGVVGLGIAANNNTTPTTNIQFTAYAANALGGITAALPIVPQAGQNTVNTFGGIVGTATLNSVTNLQTASTIYV